MYIFLLMVEAFAISFIIAGLIWVLNSLFSSNTKK